MHPPVIVSCLFTSGRFDIYQAPIQGSCFFFTNRSEIADRAQERGWNPMLVPFPCSNDPMTLSLQAKAVKFLGFLDDPIYAKITKSSSKGILYFDHKLKVESNHVRNLMACAEGKAVVIRSTPKPKNSINVEVEIAMGQERYRRHMPETRAYINQLLQHGVSADARICATGLIYYADPIAAKPLAQKVLLSCLLQKQPECQIFWAAHSQRYSNIIKVLDWDDVLVADILWRDPHTHQPPSIAARAANKLRRLLPCTRAR